MKMSDVEVPAGNKDLLEIVMEKPEKELSLIIKKELRAKTPRRYVLQRLVQRVNKLRAEEFTSQVLGNLKG